MVTFVDLFSGIGGMRMGFESAGARCVFACEWDRFARETYNANYRVDHEFGGNVADVCVDAVPDHDILLAGFPCQPYSLAGVSKRNSLGKAHGLQCRSQGNLFLEVVRVLESKQPPAFLLENVPNLLHHDSGNTWDRVRRALRGPGYTVCWQILDARTLVPQRRRRLFITGTRGDSPLDIAIPLDASIPPKLREVLHPEDGREEPEPPYTMDDGTVASKYTLCDGTWDALRRHALRHRFAGNGFGYTLADRGGQARTLSARYHKDGAEILIPQRDRNPRRLTPRECSRLMGFDRPGKPFAIPVSDTQAYRQFGNAVVPPLVELVAKRMCEQLP